jgi:glucan biosynthesis protein C
MYRQDFFIIEYFVAHSWTSTRPTLFAKEWIQHIRNGKFLQENGPLWFCLALFIFSLAYASIPSRPTRSLQPPGNAKLIGFALAMPP